MIAPLVQHPWQEIGHRLQAACTAFDPALTGHHERVSAAAADLARRLGLPADQVARIHFAAGLHDLGKLGVPREVLHRKGRLNAEEMAVIRSHTEIGHRLLDGSAYPEIRCAAEVALSHHEFWAGGGYPRGLRGEAISLEARVVAVADVFDALRSERTYKAAWTDEQVIAEMTRESATHFDPAVFAVFLEAMAARPAEVARCGQNA